MLISLFGIRSSIFPLIPIPFDMKPISPLLHLPLPRRIRVGAFPLFFSNPSLPEDSPHLPAEEVLRSCFPSLDWANTFYFDGGYYNAQIQVGDDEPEESLLRRFRREVMKAGVIKECRRRRFFESSQEKKKRKAGEAARRNRRRSRNFQPRRSSSKKQTSYEKEKKEKEEEQDNWELPKGELPY